MTPFRRMDIEKLLREYFKLVRAPEELDKKGQEEIKKMGLEQKVIGTWLSTAEKCASCDKAPYAKDMKDMDGKDVKMCGYINHDMFERTRLQTMNSEVCRYQGYIIKAVFTTRAYDRLKRIIRKKIDKNIEPQPLYECFKKDK